MDLLFVVRFHRILCILSIAYLVSALTTAEAADTNKTEILDKRCKCICPRISTGRAIYIRNVSPEQCNCDHVVLPSLTTEGQKVTVVSAGEFCAKCQCKHENRNSLTIQIVVIAFIIITGILMVYMVYLLLEARFFKPAKALAEDTSVSYEQHLDDEGYGNGTNPSTRRRSMSLTRRLSEQMARWKRAVTQQRGNVYIRRTVLNN